MLTLKRSKDRKKSDIFSSINRSRAIIEFSLDGEVVFANQNFLDMLGYTTEDITGKHHREFAGPALSNSTDYDAFWERLQQGLCHEREFKHKDAAGADIWLKASATPLLDKKGRLYGFVELVTDITDLKRQAAFYKSRVEAIGRSQAVIEFDLEGTILEANDAFLSTMGYTREEIVGRHHSLFVKPAEASSSEYAQFWASLKAGNFECQEYRRVARDGREVWIQASYNPILDPDGKPIRIVKYATDITERKLKNAYYKGQIKAINSSQAVIEFDLSGTILSANRNFLSAMGYESLDEIKGQHHSLFVTPDHADSQEYAEFWEKLGRGEFQAAEYKRIGKDGREVWIQASYNPILDTRGKPFRIVKHAVDVTKRRLREADYRGQLEAIGKSQAVIEFDLNGTVLTANENFLSVMGYHLDEVQGKHHKMFVSRETAASEQYSDFWQRLRNGEYESRVYKRIGKGGREVWIQASYNPILDMEGRPFKVVKYAIEVTDLMNTVDLTQVTTGKMDCVTDAIEEMVTSIHHIGQNMERSKQAADNISTKISTSQETNHRLIETMGSMEGIVELIHDIAGHVNLLALNATIEAARAGEAGKGFAVVASEVKNLANQTANATDEIAQKISAVQELSKEVSANTADIMEAAKSVDDYVSNAVETTNTQSEMTSQIFSNTKEASRAVQEISARIRKLSETA
ncbi:methyl-accepting chemotaxis protein [Sneathiella chinensis]|uniref:Methyl-accepting chemotaxis protein n=1 Tax=Sneathiella chinensis TaxID=349750 RepID=A0ABQ5U1Q1_9PROT|nr:PAS domain-containing methyl-accepting chemotaxis protein [Sneathiella chinensis]GLQ05110.1 methyl-accepting chemotaxis protein [Sneathiella chinensis]